MLQRLRRRTVAAAAPTQKPAEALKGEPPPSKGPMKEIPGSMRPSIQSLIRAQSCDLDVPQAMGFLCDVPQHQKRC